MHIVSNSKFDFNNVDQIGVAGPTYNHASIVRVADLPTSVGLLAIVFGFVRR